MISLFGLDPRPDKIPRAISAIYRRYTAAAMRLSGFRGAPTRPNGHKNLEPREAAQAVEQTTWAEPVDEEIESLLLSLEGEPEPVRAEEPYSAPRVGRDSRERRSARRRRHRHERVDQFDRFSVVTAIRVHQFDFFVVVTAVVLGLAVGLLTVLLVNG
jgi:hypothetical protein